MYKIKQLSEDFIVNEVTNVKLLDSGKYIYFWLDKLNLSTLESIQLIARKLNMNNKFFGFAGNKDKNAFTRQLCSVKNINKDNLQKLNIKNIKITFAGFGNKPISLGDLKGNDFEIIVRNLDKKPEIKSRFINFFGEQRFSTKNVEIGRAIIKRDFKTAIELINNNKIAEFLKDNKNNFTSALKLVPIKLLLLYVHAYQSSFWNKLAEKYRNSKENMSLPIIGFGTEVTKDVKQLLEEENISTRDFIIKEIPELSIEGSERNLFTEASDLKLGNLEDDELNSEKKKIKIKFFLPKGCYATEFIRQNFM